MQGMVSIRNLVKTFVSKEETVTLMTSLYLPPIGFNLGGLPEGRPHYLDV